MWVLLHKWLDHVSPEVVVRHKDYKLGRTIFKNNVSVSKEQEQYVRRLAEKEYGIASPLPTDYLVEIIDNRILVDFFKEGGDGDGVVDGVPLWEHLWFLNRNKWKNSDCQRTIEQWVEALRCPRHHMRLKDLHADVWVREFRSLPSCGKSLAGCVKHLDAGGLEWKSFKGYNWISELLYFHPKWLCKIISNSKDYEDRVRQYSQQEGVNVLSYVMASPNSLCMPMLSWAEQNAEQSLSKEGVGTFGRILQLRHDKSENADDLMDWEDTLRCTSEEVRSFKEACTHDNFWVFPSKGVQTEVEKKLYDDITKVLKKYGGFFHGFEYMRLQLLADYAPKSHPYVLLLGVTLYLIDEGTIDKAQKLDYFLNRGVDLTLWSPEVRALVLKNVNEQEVSILGAHLEYLDINGYANHSMNGSMKEKGKPDRL